MRRSRPAMFGLILWQLIHGILGLVHAILGSGARAPFNHGRTRPHHCLCHRQSLTGRDEEDVDGDPWSDVQSPKSAGRAGVL